MDILDVALLVGFTCRLIRLAMLDTITQPVRDGILAGAGRVGPRTLVWFDDLLSCPFCIGAWIALGVVGSWLLAGHTVAWQAVAGTFTLSYVAGHLVARLDH